MNFASDPGRDDGGLPPVNIVVPDDARELDRDVLAYRRELRARRRRERLLRVLRPLGPRTGRGAAGGVPRHGTVLPLIATCVALSMLAGAMLSVVTVSPASAPTISHSAAAAPAAGHAGAASSSPAASLPAGLTDLPAGSVRLGGKTQPIRDMTSAVVALIPGGCACGPALSRLAAQARAARVKLYFIGEGSGISQVPALAARYGRGSAVAGSDTGGVLDAAYRPAGLTVLLVYADATAQVQRDIKADFQFGPELRLLSLPGAQSAS